jgi:hypothetical protein
MDLLGHLGSSNSSGSCSSDASIENGSVQTEDDDGKNGKRIRKQQQEWNEGNEDEDNEHDDGNKHDTNQLQPKKKRLKRQLPDSHKKCSAAAIIINVIPSSQAPPDTFTRSVPHRKGHWMSHVMIPVPSSSISRTCKQKSIERFRRLIQQQQQQQQQQQPTSPPPPHGRTSSIVEHEELHVSLSKEFSLQISQIDPFVLQLSEMVSSNVDPTRLYVSTENEFLLHNEERTRSFWCWNVLPTTSPTLLHLIQLVDSLLQRYNQPTYHRPPTFHVSVASYAGRIEMDETNNHDDDDDDDDDADDDDDEEDADSSVASSSSSSSRTVIPVEHIKCTFGTTKEVLIPLKKRR